MYEVYLFNKKVITMNYGYNLGYYTTISPILNHVHIQPSEFIEMFSDFVFLKGK